jgi:hypothetical protein
VMVVWIDFSDMSLGGLPRSAGRADLVARDFCTVYSSSHAARRGDVEFVFSVIR